MNGFRIKRHWHRVAPAIVDRFRSLPVANVSDCMSRMSAGGCGLRPMHRKGAMAGPALTVKSRPGDNLMLHKAIDMAAPGDIIVCDAGGDLTNSLMGELMLALAVTKGIGGFVLNGAIRDADAFGVCDLPVFARGITHRGPYKDGPGEIGFPISLEGMVICPGDLIIGDSDGVLCVPVADAEAVEQRALTRQAAEVKQMAANRAGTANRDWVDQTLTRLGCVFVD